MDLQNLVIKNEYRSFTHDIAKEFYIPLLNNASEYRRAVGFFSSSILVKISDGIASLSKNGGSIKLIASPYLSEEDIEAIYKGYELREIISRTIIKNLEPPKNTFEQKRLNLLADIIAKGMLDIRIISDPK